MLVDDDQHDNFFHERVIRKAGVAEKVVQWTKPEEALKYLEAPDTEDHLVPDLIFLDLNMPRIDGWTFIDSYKDIENSSLKDTKVVILTTSLDPSERIRAEAEPFIHGFESKPLTAETLHNIMGEYFLS